MARQRRVAASQPIAAPAAEQIEQDRDEPGNTESGSSKQSIQASYWCFTYNNYDVEQIEMIETIFRHVCDWYVFQEEMGESGTKHLQGVMKLKKRARLTEMKKVWDGSIHWEITKSVKASVVYCTKLETRSGKVFAHGIKIPEVVKVQEPYGWQKWVMEEIINKPPHEREIVWLWEPTGNFGKSTFVKYLQVKKNAIEVGGKAGDIFNVLTRCTDKSLVVIDAPRCMMDHVSYQAIEKVKNGAFFSGKYEGKTCLFNTGHVLVFANQEPDYSKLSMDRWRVVRLQALAEELLNLEVPVRDEVSGRIIAV